MKNTTYLKKLSLALVMLVGFTNFVNAQIPSYVPTNGLVGYWPFSGNANDLSSNLNNGTNNGATLTTDRFGNADSAYSFNGVSSLITIANSTSLNFTGTSQSISFWVLLPIYQNSGKWNNNIYKASYPGLNPNGFRCGFSNQSGTSSFIYYIANGSYSTAKTAGGNYISDIGLNVWKHIVYTNDNTNLKCYVNGILLSTTPNNGTTIGSSTDPLYFGGPNKPNSSTDNFFQGHMDDIGIWNRALTIDEITNLYNANLCYQSSFIINTGILSYNPPTYNNTITIYPNPANDHITIDCGAIANVVGYRIEIANSLGQVVFNQPMNTQQYTVALNTWSGQGIYFVKVYDASNTLITTRKLILQ